MIFFEYIEVEDWLRKKEYIDIFLKLMFSMIYYFVFRYIDDKIFV